MRVLARSFYERPTLAVVEDLIGKVLVHGTGRDRTAGVIVEAEAYIGEADPACHAAPGPTRRNAPLYGPPGRAYVYLNYGIHYLVNAVTEAEGHPAAVLFRALEPIEGIALMRTRRAPRARGSGDPSTREKLRSADAAGLCRGPGNLSVALGISLAQNRADLVRGRLRIEDHGIQPDGLAWSSRIGIRVGTDHEWRCHWRGHACVSGARTRAGTMKS